MSCGLAVAASPASGSASRTEFSGQSAWSYSSCCRNITPASTREPSPETTFGRLAESSAPSLGLSSLPAGAKAAARWADIDSDSDCDVVGAWAAAPLELARRDLDQTADPEMSLTRSESEFLPESPRNSASSSGSSGISVPAESRASLRVSYTKDARSPDDPQHGDAMPGRRPRQNRSARGLGLASTTEAAGGDGWTASNMKIFEAEARADWMTNRRYRRNEVAVSSSSWSRVPQSLVDQPGRKSSNWKSNDQQAKNGGKHQCQFLIGIEEEPKFRVCRQLLGKAGAHMKRIAEATGARLRLRGRGSKFLEGPEHVESSDPLMLCVSVPDSNDYARAVSLVQEHLEQVYAEYRRFCARNNMPSPEVAVNMHEGSREGARESTQKAPETSRFFRRR